MEFYNFDLTIKSLLFDERTFNRDDEDEYSEVAISYGIQLNTTSPGDIVFIEDQDYIWSFTEFNFKKVKTTQPEVHLGLYKPRYETSTWNEDYDCTELDFVKSSELLATAFGALEEVFKHEFNKIDRNLWISPHI